MSAVVVGQKLHRPPGRNRSSWEEFTVEKIGRKWITLSGPHNRCTIESLMLDRGGYPPIQLYVDRKAFEDKAALDSEWRNMAMQISRLYGGAPAGITLDTIAQVRALLGLKDGAA